MRVKLTVGGSLRVNRPLPWDVVDAQGAVLLRKGDIPTDQKQLEALIAQGAFAHVDDAEFERQRKARATTPDASKSDPLTPWDSIYGRLATLLANPEDVSSFVDAMTSISASLLALTERSNDIAVYAMIQADQSNYPIAHAMQCAVLCAIYCQHDDWPMLDRLTLINATLTMNIAMLDLQQALTVQVEPPTPEQRQLIRNHPLAGRARLHQLGVSDQVWLQIVAQHHESADGKGYPQGLTNVLAGAELLNVADRYWAKMSRRRRRAALASDRAAGDLLLLSTGKEQAIVSRVIELFGLYPPGTFVKLANGEVAVVAMHGEDAHKPRVGVVMTPAGAAVPNPILRDTSKPEFAISYVIPEQSVATRPDPAKLFALPK